MRALIAALVAFLLTVGAAGAATPMVSVETSMGSFVVELYPDKAPRTVHNFVVYVRSGFYDGTIFHRVVPGFVVQGGGFDAFMRQKATRRPIVNEADNGLRNTRYTLSMARTADPNSATSQFFINLDNNVMLNHRGPAVRDWGYAVFGKVVRGREVVDSMARVATGRSGMHSDVPRKPIVVKRMTLLQ